MAGGDMATYFGIKGDFGDLINVYMHKFHSLKNNFI